MGKVIIQNYTTKDPISLMGYEAGTCWGSDTSNYEMNYNRQVIIKDSLTNFKF